MANEGEERFLRSSYLLLKGTFYLAKKVLLREAENVHQQTGRDLDDLLKDYEQKLKHEFRHRKQREKLFPPSGKTNVENWDISLLIGVLLIVFRQSLPGVDKTAIRNLQFQRNDFAHYEVVSLDEDHYTDTCDDLKDAFNTLASGCGTAVKQECDAIIQTCLNGALDRTSLVEHLKQLAEKDDDLLVEIIAKIEPIELREKVLKALQQALQGQRCIKVKVVDSHLCIWGTDQDQDNIAMAENIIVTVTNEAIRRTQTCEGYSRIREIIQEILDEITSQTGVKPISAEQSCVIIRFDCCSNEQLFKLIIYMESKDMKERLNKLADSLSRLLNTKEKLHVSFNLSEETLKSILDEITPTVQREYKRSVHIPIQIESAEGIKRVFELFEGGGLTNNLQKLSEALTEKVGAKINVKPSINMKQINEALQDFDPAQESAMQIGKTEECRSGESATGHKGELYVDAEEGGYESTQMKVTDHEEDIYMQRKEPEEQSIQEKPSGHKGELYVDAEEGGEESTQIRLTDHEEDTNVEREEPEEQSIQEKPSDHKEDIYVGREEPKEQSIQEKPSAHLKPMTTREERFLRSLYLLLKGTLYLAKKVVLREAENEHQETGRDLDCLLKDYEQKLKHEFRHRKHREKLFPPSGKTNVENWDISLLTGVLLIVFRKSLPDADKTAIRNIKFQINNVYAHCEVTSLDEDEYTDTCNDLKNAFNILASGCGAEVKQECDAIIQTCLNGTLDHTSHVEQLKHLAENDDSLLEMMAKIKPIELKEKVVKALQQALQGQRRIEVVDSHLGICGTDQDQDNIALAEKIIVTVTNEAIRRAQTTCEEDTRIREIIQEILDEIISQTGIKPISAEKDPAQESAIQIGKTEECRNEEGATCHKGELYVDAEDGGEESTQIKLTDNEEDIYVEREEPEEQSIKEKPSSHLKPMTTGEERFLRSSYLLLKGTLYLAKKVLLREADNVRRQTGRNLDYLLKDYEHKLKSEFRHRKHWEKLYPPNGKTNVENWDISLLTGVLRIVFRQSLSNVERRAIQIIQYQRNDVFALCGVASLDENEYTDICNDLEGAFNILASGCGAEVKQECDAIIQTCLNGALDCKSHAEQLKQFAENDDSLLEMMAIPLGFRAEVLEAVQQALQGQRRKEVKVVDSLLGICGTDEDQDNIALAETIIVTVTNEAIRREQTCEENTCIREIIQEILDEIGSQTCFDAAQKSVIQIDKTEECRSEEDATGKRDKK